MLPGFAVDFSEGFGERDVLGAGFDAVLGVGAFLDAAGAKQRVDALWRAWRRLDAC